jgi:hypothetical protein
MKEPTQGIWKNKCAFKKNFLRIFSKNEIFFLTKLKICVIAFSSKGAGRFLNPFKYI